MAGSKEIRNKIKSVQSTRKITKAMEMVSAAKMKRAQDRMRASRPYVERALQIAMHIAKANTEYKHPFLARREAAFIATIRDDCSDAMFSFTIWKTSASMNRRSTRNGVARASRSTTSPSATKGSAFSAVWGRTSWRTRCSSVIGRTSKK
jgi:hypothetical protein